MTDPGAGRAGIVVGGFALGVGLPLLGGGGVGTEGIGGGLVPGRFDRTALVLIQELAIEETPDGGICRQSGEFPQGAQFDGTLLRGE